jgi:hypothetical protein
MTHLKISQDTLSEEHVRMCSIGSVILLQQKHLSELHGSRLVTNSNMKHNV